MSHSQHKGMSEPNPASSSTSSPAETGTGTTSPDASDTVPDVTPGTTTVKTSPALWGMFGGSATETTIAAPPEAAATAAAVVASKAPTTKSPPPSPPKKPTKAQQLAANTSSVFWEFFYVFLYVLMIGLGAGAFYLNARRMGIEVPIWITVLVSLIPLTQWLSILLLFGTTVLYGLPDLSVLGGQTLWGVLGSGSKSVQVAGT